MLRGMPTPVDASGKATFTNEALSAQIKASFEEGKREAFWVAAVNGIVDVVIEFLRPSTSGNCPANWADGPPGADYCCHSAARLWRRLHFHHSAGRCPHGWADPSPHCADWLRQSQRGVL